MGYRGGVAVGDSTAKTLGQCSTVQDTKDRRKRRKQRNPLRAILTDSSNSTDGEKFSSLLLPNPWCALFIPGSGQEEQGVWAGCSPRAAR